MPFNVTSFANFAKGKVPLKVTLNGLSSNPYHAWGFTQNPFPQIAKAELGGAMSALNRLAAEPIPQATAEQHIRTILTGFSDEFVQLCISQYRPNTRVTFIVYLEKEWV